MTSAALAAATTRQQVLLVALLLPCTLLLVADSRVADGAHTDPFIISSSLLPLKTDDDGSAATFSAYAFGARGDGIHNDTAAVQAAIDAAAKVRGGVAWLPANGSYLFGGGVSLFGHQYDGVTLRLDGRVTVPKPARGAAGVWPQCAPGWGGNVNGTFPVCYLIEVYNVDGFTLTSQAGPATLVGFLYDEHKNPRPPAGMYALNCTNFLWENVGFQHVSGAVFIHNTQNVLIRNMSINNRGVPIEENGDLEVGGVGSHGEPYPGRDLWQWQAGLMSANNITIRDSWVDGGDDNVCIKNDTSNVLVENVVFYDGHGATIGSVPDGNGLRGFITNVTFRNITMKGNAPVKIKSWPNTTGEVSNILYEDVTLVNADTAIDVGTFAPCKWCHPFAGSEKTKCRAVPFVGPPVDWGGQCSQGTQQISMVNITFRRFRGTVKSPGMIRCREINPCKFNFEDVTLTTDKPWICGNLNATIIGTMRPSLPSGGCAVGPHPKDEKIAEIDERIGG
jgi:hypothetical protein